MTTSDRPVMSLTEGVAAILAGHPSGLMIDEIRRHCLWSEVDGTWKNWLSDRPSRTAIIQVLTRADKQIATSSRTEPYANEGFWTPTELGLSIGRQQMELLSIDADEVFSAPGWATEKIASPHDED